MTGDWLGPLPPGIKAKAFARSDLYGTYANNPLPIGTKLRLFVLCLTLVPLKLCACIFCVVSYFIAVSIGNGLLAEPFRTRYMAFWGRFWTRAVLYCLGFWSIKWVYVNPDGSTSGRPSAGHKASFGCYVSNHCSWVDIVLYMSYFFPSFVAKKEVSGLPLIGAISKAMQCLFVDREARIAAAAAEGQGDGSGQGMSQLVKERMLRRHAGTSDELPMLLFPEGTTTNNRFLMPFKRGAFVAGAPVLPIVLRYDTSGRFSPTWDAMPGHHHILLAMTEIAFRVTAYVLPVYVPSEAEVKDPALYAEGVRQAMVRFSGIPACDETFADKLAFFKYVVERMAQQKRGLRQGRGRERGRSGAEGDAAQSGDGEGKANGVKAAGGGSAAGGEAQGPRQRVEVQAHAEVSGLRQRKEVAS